MFTRIVTGIVADNIRTPDANSGTGTRFIQLPRSARTQKMASEGSELFTYCLAKHRFWMNGYIKMAGRQK